MNHFVVMLKTRIIGWGIDQFLHFFIIICLHSYKQLFTVAFLALDKNETSNFQKP